MGGMIRPMSACSLSVWSEIISGLVTSSRHMLWERGVKMKLSFLLFSNVVFPNAVYSRIEQLMAARVPHYTITVSRRNEVLGCSYIYVCVAW